MYVRMSVKIEGTSLLLSTPSHDHFAETDKDSLVWFTREER